MKSFSQYLAEKTSTVYFTFGRFNPPTNGHQKLLDKIAKTAGGDPMRIYVSQSQDSKKNPLPYEQKIKFMRKMFPKYARSIIMDKSTRNIIEIATSLYTEGFRNIVMVVGQDRVREFEVRLNKYNGQKALHGFYDFDSIEVVSAGDRDPDADDVSGMSASKQRAAVAANDYQLFLRGVPKGVSDSLAKELFNAIRSGMGLTEARSFRASLNEKPTSEVREQYITGDLFSEGDTVVISETDEIATITVCGSNYVIIETVNGNKMRKWLTDIEKI
jgi:phosphopantetheine adenylyltransferase